MELRKGSRESGYFIAGRGISEDFLEKARRHSRMSKPALKMVREDGVDSVLDQGYTKRLQSKEKSVQIMLVDIVIIAYLIMRCVIGA